MKFTKVSAILVLFFLSSVSLAAGADKQHPFWKFTKRSTFQKANMLNMQNFSMDIGAVTLVRERDSIKANLSLIGLDANTAYTVWWVVFNNPEHCASGPESCGESDLVNPDVETAIFYAAGFTTGMDGTANISSEIDGRGMQNQIEGLPQTLPGALNRKNGFGAAIQMAVGSHGSIKAGDLASQVGNVCDDTNCTVVQYVSFPPVSMH